jgi:polysaccharide export outer membrane protein
VRLDEASDSYVAEIRLKTLVDAVNPEHNIAIRPRDIIAVPKGDIVYVVGTVRKSGGFVVGEKAHLTVLEALSMAEGLERFADSRKAKILRTQPGETRRAEITVDLEKLLAGHGEDLAMRPDDILFVPANKTRSAAMRTLETALGVGGNITTGLVVYRR